MRYTIYLTQLMSVLSSGHVFPFQVIVQVAVLLLWILEHHYLLVQQYVLLSLTYSSCRLLDYLFI